MLIGSSTSFVGESQIGSDDSNSQTVSPGVGGLTLAGFAALIFVNVIVAPGVGSLSAQGLEPTVTASDHQTVQPGVASLAVTGFAPTVTASDSQTVSPDVGLLALAGFAPIISASDNQTVAAGLGELVLSGFAPTVSATDQQTVAPDVGSLILSGFEPSIAVDDNQNVASGLGALSLTGFAPSVSASDNQTVLSGTGQLAVAGFSPTITSAANQTVTPGTGALVLSGYAPTVVASISLALYVDSTGGPRYRVRSSGSPSYSVDSTGGNRYRVVRGHGITSALEVVSNVIPYDSLSTHPLAIAVEDFSGSETIADFITAFDLRWPIEMGDDVSGLSFATLNGRRVLKVPQGSKLAGGKELPSLYPVLWSRSLIHIADSFAPLGGTSDTGIATASMSDDLSTNWDFRGGAEYQPDYNVYGASEVYYAGDLDDGGPPNGMVALPLSGIKNRVLSQVARLEVPLSTQLGNLNVWIDGVKLFSGTLRYYGAFDGLKGLMCNFGNDLLAGGPSDPTNNYFYGILEEFVPGALGDSASPPYSGLEP